MHARSVRSPGALAALPILALLTAALAISALPPSAYGQLPRNESGLGLSTHHGLGLPGVALDGVSVGYRQSLYYSPAYRFGGPYRLSLERARRRPLGARGYDWTPWEPAPQTLRSKLHYPSIYATPRLGLHHVYGADPFGPGIGLDPVPETDEPIVAAGPDPFGGIGTPAVFEAVSLMREGRYALAGRLLAPELRHPPAPLDVYVVVAEVLMATGKFQAAGNIFLYGLEASEQLDALSDIAVVEHFPGQEEFRKHVAALEGAAGAGAESVGMHLLATTLRAMTGESAAVARLGELEAAGGRGSAQAQRLYLQFVDRLFDAPDESQPEKAPTESEPIDKDALEKREA